MNPGEAVFRRSAPLVRRSVGMAHSVSCLDSLPESNPHTLRCFWGSFMEYLAIRHRNGGRRRRPACRAPLKIAAQFNDVFPHGAGPEKPPVSCAIPESLHLSTLYKQRDSGALAGNTTISPSIAGLPRRMPSLRKSKGGCATTPFRWSFRTTSHHPPRPSDERYRSTFSSRYSFRTTAWSPSPGFPLYTRVIRPFWASSASRSMASTR